MPIVFPLEPGQQGADVRNLQDALADLLQRRVLFPDDRAARAEIERGLRVEREREVYRSATERLVGEFQARHDLHATGRVDEPTAAVLNRLLGRVPEPPPPPPDRPVSGETKGWTVSGAVWSRASAAVEGLAIKVVDKSVGEDRALADAASDVLGEFHIVIADTAIRGLGKALPDLQAQAWRDGRKIGESHIAYDARGDQRLDIMLGDEAAKSLPSEYETLRTAVGRHVGGSLARLQEDEDRRDLTYLANKTGWDARAVALGSLADRFAEESNGVSPAFFYALMRAGVPADEASIFALERGEAERIWRAAIAAGTIPRELEREIGPALKRYGESSAVKLLDHVGVPGAAPLHALLGRVLRSPDERLAFADLRMRHGDDHDGFWRAAQDKFGRETTDALRLDGQLAFLTLNNAALIEDIVGRGASRIGSTADLVEAGLHRPEAWLSKIPEGAVPDPIPGRDDPERRANYAGYLAAQIRLAHPTATLARMVRDGDVAVTAGAGEVADFLERHRDEFAVGAEPVSRFAARKNLEVEPGTRREIERIQRVYQITPDDKAMTALLASGVDSAAAVASIGRDAFIAQYGDALGGEAVARMAHAKAQQVHAATMGLAVAYATARAGPTLGYAETRPMLSAMPMGAASAGDVPAYATLESLFGEMDYCACEHCRSVLSPAAYLVDLLLFLDSPSFSPGFSNPLNVLLDRRPDIAHLALTCANTNTPQPYIDLVNEILEHFVAKGTLDAYHGHSTLSTEDADNLQASPRFVIDAAYEKLAESDFPPPLPFDRSLELVRRLLQRFEMPLAQAMTSLRPGEALDAATGAPYGWREIRHETAGFSPREISLLTRNESGTGSKSLRTVKRLFGFPAAATESKVRAELENARAFCRRVGITYSELVEILRTRFINPDQGLLRRLDMLALPIKTLKAFKDGTLSPADFEKQLPPGLEPQQFGGDIKGWVKHQPNFERIVRLITLVNPVEPEDICSFDKVELRYTDPDGDTSHLSMVEFARMMRFIRIWRKLGWGIAQTDRALAALYPFKPSPATPDEDSELTALAKGFSEALPRLGVLIEAMSVLNVKPGRELDQLLASFGPMDAAGPGSLYHRIFRDGLKSEAFGENGFGEVLDGSKKLLKHAEVLRGGLSLTADEFAAISQALDYNAATKLTIANISAIYRRGWLARKLKLSVVELLGLIEATGLDPFAKVDPATPALLDFVRLVGQLRENKIKPGHALFLFWNIDVSGRAARSQVELGLLVRALSAAMAAVEGEYASTDDPSGSIGKTRFALVHGAEAAEFLFGLFAGTPLLQTSFSQDEPELAGDVIAAGSGRLEYDHARGQLRFAGLMRPADRDALNAAAPSAAFKQALARLFAASEQEVAPFFARNPHLLPAYEEFLADDRPLSIRRAALVQAALPELKRARKRQQALQTLAAVVGVEEPFAKALLSDPLVLSSTIFADEPAIADVVESGEPGLSASFYFKAAVTGTPDLGPDRDPSLDHQQGANPLPRDPTDPQAPLSAQWDGFVEPPESAGYELRIIAPGTSTVTLAVDGAQVALTKKSGSWTTETSIALVAGKLYPVVLTATDLGAEFRAEWRTLSGGWSVLPASALYAAGPIRRLLSHATGLRKAAEVAQACGLAATETGFLAARTGWLRLLPGAEGGLGAAQGPQLLPVLRELLAFARLKRAWTLEDGMLAAILAAPEAAVAADGPLLLAARWAAKDVGAVLERIGLDASELDSAGALDRLDEAMAVVSGLAVPAVILLNAVSRAPGAGADDLRDALRARYDEEGWLAVLRPIMDEMRALQRDALVTFILRAMADDPASRHIDTPDKLYEYFLVDVAMEPCMLTSRVRLALSSVQQFVERCLLNLEPRITSRSLDPEQWKWMKRYRVWEANRKVFLFPENWLEPDLRDDQSTFFRETMSELLQGELTDDRAEQAMMGYLAKLADVAKLEVCGTHFEAGEPGASDDIVHVVARTAGANRRYFYRRRDTTWSPWEKIPHDIDDNPVVPLVWNGRLFVFWLKLIQQPSPVSAPRPTGSSLANVDPATIAPASPPQFDVSSILCWSERFGGKWQPPRTSDANRPLPIARFVDAAAAATLRDQITISMMFWTQRALRVMLSCPNQHPVSFFLHNAYSAPELREFEKDEHFKPKRSIDTAGEALVVGYAGETSHAVLANHVPDGAIAPRHPAPGESWDQPFFYQDSRYAFYVTTATQHYVANMWADYGVVSVGGAKRTSPPGAAIRVPGWGAPGPHLDRPPPGGPDPWPINRYFGGADRVRVALEQRATVRFGNRDIGPGGSRANQLLKP